MEKEVKIKINLEQEIEKFLTANAQFLIESNSKLTVQYMAEYFFKLGKKYAEQNAEESAWNKDDEDVKETIIGELELVKKSVGEINYKAYDKLINWLKSLKERYTWNPSDEQMKALHELNLTGNVSYAGQGQTLIELYNDLKKLKGE